MVSGMHTDTSGTQSVPLSFQREDIYVAGVTFQDPSYPRLGKPFVGNTPPPNNQLLTPQRLPSPFSGRV